MTWHMLHSRAVAVLMKIAWCSCAEQRCDSQRTSPSCCCRVRCEVRNTAVGRRKDETMHSISAGSAGPQVVFMPGYAAGAAFFYRNLKALSEHVRVHLVDWLGTGCSGRPPFKCRSREGTEAWFVESLERWRKEAGLDQMVLVGHSLGGYLSTCYALAYPDRVQHLILVNPAGMVRRILLHLQPCTSSRMSVRCFMHAEHTQHHCCVQRLHSCSCAIMVKCISDHWKAPPRSVEPDFACHPDLQ